MNTKKEIRIGLIGTGIIAHSHVEAYQSIPGVKIVAACDLDESKLNRFCALYDIENKYTNFRELLARDDLDGVDVCVHNNLHMPISVEVLRAGFHCYCEKPMAGSYADAKKMLDVAAECERKLHIQLAMLYSPQAHAAKKFVDENKLGQIYHARSYGYRRRGRPFVDGYATKEFNSKYWAAGGALYDMGVYHISLLLYLLGTPKVERISGQVYQEVAMDEDRRREGGFDVEELGCGFIKFENNLTMDILESWAIHGGMFAPSMLAGSQGGLTIYSVGRDIGSPLIYHHEELGYPADTEIDVNAEIYRTRQKDPELSRYDGSQNLWIAALRNECELLDTAKIALNTMLISEGIFMSGALGREVTRDEIISASKCQAILKQETPFGMLTYDV